MPTTLTPTPSRPAPAGEHETGFAWCSFLIPALLAALLFVSFGSTRSLWLDEAFSINLAQSGLGSTGPAQSGPAAGGPATIIQGLKADGHPPLYFFILAGWSQLFGTSEFIIRILSGLFFLATVVAIFILGRIAWGSAAPAFLAAFLYLVSKTAVAQAQNARMYSLLACWVALSTLFYFRAWFSAQKRPRDEALFVVVTCAGSFTHLWFCFTALAQAVAFAVLGPRDRRIRYLALTTLAFLPYFVLWLPILLTHQIHNGVSDWMSGRRFGLRTLLLTFADYYGEGLLGGLVWLGFLTLLLFRLEGWRPRVTDRAHWRAIWHELRTPPAATFLLLAGVSLITPLLISQFRPIYRIGSYTIIALVPLVLVLGPLLARFADRKLLALFAAGLLVASCSAFVWLQSRPEPFSDRTATHYLLEQVQEHDVVIFTSLSRAGIDYYLRRLAPERQLTRFSFPGDIDRHPGWRSPQDQLNRLAALTQEADDLVAGLQRTLPPGARVWLFYGVDKNVAHLLKDRLDLWLEVQDEHLNPAAFYKTILCYKQKA